MEDDKGVGSAPPIGAGVPAHALLRGILTAYSVGDAMGMPTEFMTRAEIRSKFGMVERLLEPEESRNHPTIPKGSITDDTEQLVALLDEYAARGRVDANDTARRLLRWMRESGAIEKRYIGPSSKAALESIESGTPVEKAGLGGTTCGGVMRSPAAVLFAEAHGLPLAACVRACLVPTHFSALALGPAMAYACALRAAMRGEGVDRILLEAEAGEADGARLAPYPQCGPSTVARARTFGERAASFAGADTDTDVALDFIYSVLGTTLASADVAAATLCLFIVAKTDVWLAIRMGASIGGDTDTIAALAGALCAAHALARGIELTIPEAIVLEVLARNNLDFDPLINRLLRQP